MIARLWLDKERDIGTSVNLKRLGIALQLHFVASHQLDGAAARAEHDAKVAALDNAERGTLWNLLRQVQCTSVAIDDRHSLIVTHLQCGEIQRCAR